MSEAINCNFLNINNPPTTVNEAQNIANPLKSKNSYQYNWILQGYSNIYDFITVLWVIFAINQSMDGTFPDRLKYSKVVCVFKKADNYCAYNYKPVSLY
jgi:hypothetical protein